MNGDEFDPSGLTALVVDDNHFERGISLDQLRSMGFRRALGAANTMEGWDTLKKANPDVIMLEWFDGAGDGLDFVRRVRQSEEAPNRAASIFMLTSRGALADVETARRAGVDGYLRKPISALALQQRVRTVVTNPQPFIATPTYVGPCRRRRRPDLNYLGPRRRLDDAADASLDDAEIEVKAQLARASVAALEAHAKALTSGDAKAARHVFKAAQGLIEVAEQIGDAMLASATREMARYLQAQGATERLDPEVVRTHVAALHQLAHLPHALGGEREAVAKSLKRMVDKKLRQLASDAA
ncbi:MAG TPA: response regulator [Vitreimonas sp.]|uniref:response regulator n=1 Tax=Vitreimonas sp. TaxID=3069702 RepID=UPI002D2DCB69|nr:response regulator [Vitreimonas sp.]HYD86645.1 response regulator [Vitreimonas sp.]